MRKRRNKASRPRFNLDGNPKNRDPQLIYLVYHYKKDDEGKTVQLKYSTGIRVRRTNWDSKMHRAKPNVTFDRQECETVNSVLRKLEQGATKIVTNNRDINIDDFKLELDYIIGVKNRPKRKDEFTLLEYIPMFLRRKDKKEYRTLQKYRTTQKHLSNFQQYLGSPITFDQINPEFAENFEQWLYRHTKVSSQNTTNKILQNVKEFMADAHENGYHANARFKSRKFSVSRVTTTKQFLELEDLRRLAEHKFDSVRLDRTRDLWLIAAYTGLRYSDFSRLASDDIIEKNGIKMIRINTFKGRTTKSDNEVVIPVLDELEKILVKYNYDFPRSYSSQKMNDYIKEVCKEVGLDRLVKVKKSVKGKIVESRTPLFQEITNHTARYTFINIMLNDFDIPAADLRKITGQSLKVLMGYERGDKMKNAAKVLAKVQKEQKRRKLRAI